MSRRYRTPGPPLPHALAQPVTPLPDVIWIDERHGEHPEDWTFTPDHLVKAHGGNAFTKHKVAYRRDRGQLAAIQSAAAKQASDITRLRADIETLKKDKQAARLADINWMRGLKTDDSRT